MVSFDVERLAKVPTSNFNYENEAEIMHVEREPMQAIWDLACLLSSKYINHGAFSQQECCTKRLLSIESLFQ